MVYCCVLNCHRNPKTDSGKVKFYRFPKRNFEQRELWIKKIGRIGTDGKPWQPSKYSVICSDHFLNGMKSPTRNHPSYIPTLFPPEFSKFNPCFYVGLYLDFPIVGAQEKSCVGIMSLLEEQYEEEEWPLSVHWEHDYSKPSFESGKKID